MGKAQNLFPHNKYWNNYEENETYRRKTGGWVNLFKVTQNPSPLSYTQ